MLPRIYYFDRDIFRYRIGKRVYKLKRLFLTLLIVTIISLFIEWRYLMILSSFILKAMSCFVAVLAYFFMLYWLKEENLCSKYKDIVMMIDKDIPLFIVPCEKNNELIDVYQCNSIDSIVFEDELMVISGELMRSSLNLNSIKADNEQLTELKVYRIFSESAEKELKSYIAKKE